jgi:hypothetical protein
MKGEPNAKTEHAWSVARQIMRNHGREVAEARKREGGITQSPGDSAIQRLIKETAQAIADRMAGIVETRVYTAERAAELIGLESERRAKSIRKIPPELLPFVHITPGGGRIGYLGRDLLRYLEQQRRTRSDGMEAEEQTE